ncbi:MAG: YggT family protein [bacterium]|nr:YggT family protein [bacterium]
MPETLQRIGRTNIVSEYDTAERNNSYTNSVLKNPSLTTGQLIIQNIAGIISSLLLLRFFLALFGVSETNGLVNLLYSFTNPLVAPFNGLFTIDTNSGASRFEINTLVATIAYVLAGLAIVRLFDVSRSRNNQQINR